MLKLFAVKVTALAVKRIFIFLIDIFILYLKKTLALF